MCTQTCIQSVHGPANYSGESWKKTKMLKNKELMERYAHILTHVWKNFK